MPFSELTRQASAGWNGGSAVVKKAVEVEVGRTVNAWPHPPSLGPAHSPLRAVATEAILAIHRSNQVTFSRWVIETNNCQRNKATIRPTYHYRNYKINLQILFHQACKSTAELSITLVCTYCSGTLGYTLVTTGACALVSGRWQGGASTAVLAWWVIARVVSCALVTQSCHMLL